MDYATLITVGVIVFGFAGQILFIRGSFTEKFKEHDRRLCEHDGKFEVVEKQVRFAETCNAISEGLKERVRSLESTRNGKR